MANWVAAECAANAEHKQFLKPEAIIIEELNGVTETHVVTCRLNSMRVKRISDRFHFHIISTACNFMVQCVFNNI